VAIGARCIGGVNRVGDLGERAGGHEDIRRIGAVRRIQFGGDREFARPERAFESAAG
jgi:hypothetical protein